MTARLRIALLASTLAIGVVLGTAPGASAATVSMCNVPIKMSDGTILRANVFLPNKGGRYPVSLTATGYNKDITAPPGSCSPSGGLVSANAKLLSSGYAIMVLDDRGTGASQGKWSSWDQRTQNDYGEVLDWIQGQPWSNGDVATTGTSYMAITSLLIAEKDLERVAAGKRRAVKTVWADVPMSDAYRDVTYHGGSTDAGFIPLWLGLVGALSAAPPSTFANQPDDAAATYIQHQANLFDFQASKIAEATLGGDAVYDGPFYRLRSPGDRAGKLKIPVAWGGGWWDIFQRGEPLLWEQLTSASKRVLWMTPRYHTSDDDSQWNAQKMGTRDDVQLRWYERYLKGKRNATDRLSPVNLYTMGVNRWQHLSRWPVPGTRYTRWHLNGDKSGSARSINDGGLATPAPRAAGADSAPLLPASSPCSRLTAQWTAGLAAASNCETDNSSYEASSLTYTTKPLGQAMEVTGLVTADLWAELTAPEATLVAVLSDVAPSGESTQLSAGFLLASQRAIDQGKSTKGPGGIVIRPWHPFTRASQKPVPAGTAQRYLIEIYPTSNVFKKGHRIRLTVGTANTPSTATPVPNLVNETGGEIRMLRSPGRASNVLLPVVTDSDVVGGGGLGCLARRSPIGPRNVGRVRIGMTKKQLLRKVPAPRRRAKRAWRWCVKGGGGSVRAAFTRRGRVQLVATTAPRHGNRKIHRGSSARRVRKAYPRRRSIGRTLFRANRRSPRLIGVRRGKVTYIAVAPRKLIVKRRTLRSYLRLAGVR